MVTKTNAASKPFSSINLFSICPFCQRPYPTRDAWLLHVGLDHTEIAIRLLESAKLR